MAENFENKPNQGGAEKAALSPLDFMKSGVFSQVLQNAGFDKAMSTVSEAFGSLKLDSGASRSSMLVDAGAQHEATQFSGKFQLAAANINKHAAF